MKKLCLFSLIIAFVLVSTTVYAAERAPLGKGNIALKLDYLQFTEDDLDDLDANTGAYVGIEGYTYIAPNLYLGAEVGYANPEGEAKLSTFFGSVDVDTEIDYIPIEVNLKYTLEAILPNLVIDLGAGVSYNYARAEVTVGSGFASESDDDIHWLLGAQCFTDLNYKINEFFVGINGKYQITEDFEDVNFNNWRIGGQIGIMF